MQQGPAGAVDQGGRIIELELPHVSFAQVKFDPLLRCADSSLREHRGRSVDPNDALARCLGDLDRDPSIPNRELDQWPVSIMGKPDVERDVSSDSLGPGRVPVRPGVVPVRHGPAAYAGSGRAST